MKAVSESQQQAKGVEAARKGTHVEGREEEPGLSPASPRGAKRKGQQNSLRGDSGPSEATGVATFTGVNAWPPWDVAASSGCPWSPAVTLWQIYWLGPHGPPPAFSATLGSYAFYF